MAASKAKEPRDRSEAIAKSLQIEGNTVTDFSKGMEVAAKLGATGAVGLLANAQLRMMESMTALAKQEAEQSEKSRAERGTEFTEHRSWDS